MKEFYYRYLEFNGWQEVQRSLLNMYYTINQSELFYALSADEVEAYDPKIMKLLTKAEVEINHIFFIKFPGPTDLAFTDPNDSRTVYIHTDRIDEGSAADNSNKFVNTIAPRYALNIPLLNCDSSTTFFYKVINQNKKELIWKGWSKYISEDDNTMIDHNNVEKVDQMTLDKPALIKINSPHGVHNPLNDFRVVASIR